MAAACISKLGKTGLNGTGTEFFPESSPIPKEGFSKDRELDKNVDVQVRKDVWASAWVPPLGCIVLLPNLEAPQGSISLRGSLQRGYGFGT